MPYLANLSIGDFRSGGFYEIAATFNSDRETSRRQGVSEICWVLRNGVPTSAEPIAITEQTTPEFRNDLNRLSPGDRTRVAVALRRSYDVLRNNRGGFFARAQRPRGIQLKGGFSSSLYSLRVGRDIRLILAVDEDPIFAQTLVTLFRAVRHNELDRAYRSVAGCLYRNQIQRNGGSL